MMTAQLHGQGIAQALKDVVSKDSTNEAEEKRKTVLRNRAQESRSPYVRGHGSNPVAWQLWGDEAIELARKENKCLFVSIGYSACHWCHVMERESFENDEVAAILNEAFIPVKIDREERPDIDRIYMNFVQATTGSGGWPLNVFVTPELQPIFGGTYWPGPTSSTQSIDQVDFLGILNKLSTVWKEQEMRCRQESSQILQQLKNFAAEGTFGDRLGEGSDALDLEILEEANQHFASTFDKTNGGFGSAPKFPTPAKLSFLLRIGQYPQAVLDVVGPKECRDSENMAITTLRKMARGGIHDHIGSGFARYSVTDDWSLPHFEKMLYDNAQLLDIYLDGFLLCRDAELLGVVYDLANYLTTTLAHPEGGFYSSEDADSFYRKGDTEKREGAFYVWTKREFENILGEKAHPILSAFFNVRSHGNVLPENDAHDEFIDQNVLAIVSSPVVLAAQFGLKEDEVVKIIKEGKQKLKEHREKERVRPALDDKIVVGWNGIALGALARTVTDIRQFDPERAKTYMDSAVKAANFIKENLYDADKRLLWRVYREGRGDSNAFADDYAFLIEGLIDLYEATFDEKWLQWADELQQSQILQFYDDTTGAFFSTASSAPHTILRLKDGMDSAEPSTNGVSASNLYRLGSLLNDAAYTRKAKETVGGFESELLQYPWLFSGFMPSIVAGSPGNTGVKGVVVSGSPDTPIVKAKIEEYAAAPRGTLVTMAKVDSQSKWLRERNSLLKDFALDGKARILICENGTCREETDEELEQVRDITNSGATLSIAAEKIPVSLDANKAEEKDTTATEAKPIETPSIPAEGIENMKAPPITEGAL